LTAAKKESGQKKKAFAQRPISDFSTRRNRMHDRDLTTRIVAQKETRPNQIILHLCYKFIEFERNALVVKLGPSPVGHATCVQNFRYRNTSPERKIEY
jgi:hypothetical protein